MLVAFVVTMILSGIAIAACVSREHTFLTAEHLAWSKASSLASFTSKSPGGAFKTVARKHGGDGLSSHSEKHDCIFVEKIGCPESAVEFASQDHAMCETDWWGCNRGDGVLMHEQFGMKLQWLDAKRIKISWTELTGLDADGHRIWGKRSAVRRLQTVKTADGPKCGEIEVVEDESTILKE